MSKILEIDGRLIGHGHRPYVIAEMSGNHNGDIERAKALIRAAKRAGADAVKLQTFTADTLTIDHDGPEFMVDLPLWKQKTLYQLYSEAQTPWEWHSELFALGRELGITVFSSPFDSTALDLLKSLDAPAYKIASPELVDLPLIESVAAVGKPMIMSTGMATLEEIGAAVDVARGAGCKELILLHCVSAYPTPYDQACIKNIAELTKRFDVLSGLSDHSMGTAVPVAATALGASVIEKHFTLRRSDGGVDSQFSLEPDELELLVKDVGVSWEACGGPEFGPKKAEEAVLKYRRSLYAVEDINAGCQITRANVRSIRPGNGLPPKYMPDVLGRVANRNISRGEPLSWDMFGTE